MISILLACYNGERYIEEQIESLLNQTFSDFKLFIRDDKSTDATYPLICEYAKRYPEKIFVSQNRENTTNAKYNFINMMTEHKDDYVMLCDQDDVWLPDKIEKSLAKIRELESQYGKSVPLLVHTDLKVVDKDLNVISPSYVKMSKTDFGKNALNNLLTRNVAAGCTQIYNRTLADLLYAAPDFIIIHDWWTTLIASAFGKIQAVRESTILYRQHENNSIGAKKTYSFAHLRYRLTNHKKWRKTYNDTYKQAESLLNMYRGRLSREQSALLSDYASMPERSAWGKLRVLSRHRAFMYGIRKFGQIFIILTEKRNK